MITLTSADNALKTFYLDAVTESLDYKANPLLAQIGRSTADVVGKDVKKLVRMGINGGMSAGSETGDLPMSSTQNSVQFTSTLKNLYGTISITDKALRASSSDEGAFVNLLNNEMQSLIKSASFNFGRMLYGDGQGLLCEVVKNNANNTLIVTDSRCVIEGMLVDFYMGDMPIAESEGLRIVSVNRETNEIAVSGNIGAVQGGAKMYLQGAHGYELTGLKAIFEKNTLYGVDRTFTCALKPYMKDEVGEIDENTIQKAIDAIEENSGSKVNFIVCSWGVRRALVEHYKQFKTMLPSMKIEGGFTALSFNGIPVVADRFCPAGTMYLLNTDDFKIYQLCDWKWLEGEDGKILKQIPGKPMYTATLVKYAELMCERPGGQGRLTGITEA